MFGESIYSSVAFEREDNQARLEYYASNELRIKYNSLSEDYYYWLASPDSRSALWFCGVKYYGGAYYDNASAVGGCAPAFCVR